MISPAILWDCTSKWVKSNEPVVLLLCHVFIRGHLQTVSCLRSSCRLWQWHIMTMAGALECPPPPPLVLIVTDKLWYRTPPTSTYCHWRNLLHPFPILALNVTDKLCVTTTPTSTYCHWQTLLHPPPPLALIVTDRLCYTPPPTSTYCHWRTNVELCYLLSLKTLLHPPPPY